MRRTDGMTVAKNALEQPMSRNESSLSFAVTSRFQHRQPPAHTRATLHVLSQRSATLGAEGAGSGATYGVIRESMMAFCRANSSSVSTPESLSFPRRSS